MLYPWLKNFLLGVEFTVTVVSDVVFGRYEEERVSSAYENHLSPREDVNRAMCFPRGPRVGIEAVTMTR